MVPLDRTGLVSEGSLFYTSSHFVHLLFLNLYSFLWLCFQTNGPVMIPLHRLLSSWSVLLSSVSSVFAVLCNEALLSLSSRQTVIITSKVKQTAVHDFIYHKDTFYGSRVTLLFCRCHVEQVRMCLGFRGNATNHSVQQTFVVCQSVFWLLCATLSLNKSF